jgi:purine-nucleoside/S-methyl-5'-thioadenosine phosphorylase / adenosine deaminase
MGKVAEDFLPGEVPRYEIPDWKEHYGVVAGITGRGDRQGRGFDLGLWSGEPVGEVMSRWRAFRRAALGFHAVVLGNQIHGVAIGRVEGGLGWIQVEGTDGWVTTTPGVLLTVTVADCVPVYLTVPGRGIALLHAGWRGTAGGILDRGLRALLVASGATEADVAMHCGVGICGNCYEVGSEVMTGCGLPAIGSGPWHLDLRSVLADRARALGIAQVTTSSWCSAHHRPSFYSHRASRGQDGRMVGYLGMLSPLASKPL